MDNPQVQSQPILMLSNRPGFKRDAVVLYNQVSGEISLIEGKTTCSVYFHPHQRSLGDTLSRQRPTKGDFSVQMKVL